MIEIVYIGAAWCGTCKTIKPAIVELSRRFSVKVKLLDYDIDLEPEAQEEIKKVPTIKITRDGRKVAEFDTNQVASTESWLAANMKLTVTDDF
jgi:thioredoxin-like negative regulator of GroEL